VFKIWHPSQEYAWLIVPLFYMLPSFTWLVIYNSYHYITSGIWLFDLGSALVFAVVNGIIALWLMWKYLYIGPPNTITPLIGPLGITVQGYSMTEGWNILFAFYRPMTDHVYNRSLHTFPLSVISYDKQGRSYYVRVLFSAMPNNAHTIFRAGKDQSMQVFVSAAKSAVRKFASNYAIPTLLLSRDLVVIDRSLKKVFASVGLRAQHAIVEEVKLVARPTAELIERTANRNIYARDARSVEKMVKSYIRAGLPRDIAAQLVAERQGIRRVADSNFRISGKGARGARPFLDARN
jgi:hypothetical protein